MNIEKLAKHLKEFTLDEINMIAECDCETELETLIQKGFLILKNGIFTFSEKRNYDFKIFITPNLNQEKIYVEDAINYFMKNYVEKHCKKKTYRTYRGQFKYSILPVFQNKLLNEVSNQDIIDFYLVGIDRGLKPRKLKNDLALLNQIIRYFQNLGIIDKRCVFQVKRLTDKNNVDKSNVVFE